MSMDPDSIDISGALRDISAALRHLGEAQRQLRVARNFGIADVLGGGLIISALKRSRIENARREIELANISIHRMMEKLGQHPRDDEVYFDPDGVLGIADFAFDSFVSDLSVQSEINDARREVDATIDKLYRIRERLMQMAEQG